MIRSIIPTNTAEVLITQKCPLACTYCFEKCKSNKDIDFEECLSKFTKEGNFTTFPIKSFYIFGGEPLMNTDFMVKLIEWIDTNETMNNEYKKNIMHTIMHNITTNGVLIQKELDVLKKYNATVQVSLDGPEDINDACRVDHNGKGHFQQIMDNLELCRQNNIGYSIHGVVAKPNYKNFCRINEWFLSEALKNRNLDFTNGVEKVFFHNYAQIVFEDEITDEDIDIILDQFKQTIDMIMTTPLLDKYSIFTRKTIAEGFLNRRGGTCAAGVVMFSYDDDFNIFPCHRLNTSEENRIANRLGSLKDDKPFNYPQYLQFIETRRRGEMYGADIDNYGFTGKGGNYWVNWCPSTNWETSHDVFHIASKHTVLLAELQRLLPALADYYNLNINNPKFTGSR